MRKTMLEVLQKGNEKGTTLSSDKNDKDNEDEDEQDTDHQDHEHDEKDKTEATSTVPWYFRLKRRTDENDG